MKKYLYKLILATLILIGTTVVKAANGVYYINREGIEMTEQQYHNLQQLGFTDAQIYRMDLETFEENKDIEATLLSETTQYYHTTTFMRNGIKYSTTAVLTEEEFYKSMNNHDKLQGQQPPYAPNTSGNFYNGIVDDDYKILRTTITSVDDDTMRYKADVFWEEIPSTRSYDIIGIGIEQTKVEINSMIAFRQDFEYSNGDFDYGLVCSPKEQTSGGSAMFELPSGSLVQLESYTYFNVIKVDPETTLDLIYATGDYAHAISNVSSNVFYNYIVSVGNGITIYGNYSLDYQDIPNAVAHFLGTW